MTALIGGECSAWLIIALLVLSAGLGTALFAAVRGAAGQTRRTSQPR